MDRSGDAEARVRAAEERIFTALRTKDVPALEAELAHDFVHTAVGSPDQGRDAFLRAVRDMPYRILELHGIDLRVRVFGDVAVLSGLQRARVSLADDQIVSGTTAFVDTFTRIDDGWRLRHAVSIELPATEGGE
jgi:ketosteroid isomerase-like protein